MEARRRPRGKLMKQFWSAVLIVILAVALPLRVFAMPLSACCVDDPPSYAALHNAARVSSSDSCDGHIDCSIKGQPTDMSHASCMAICAAVAALPIAANLAQGSWRSILVAHRESSFPSVVLALLERPPKAFSA